MRTHNPSSHLAYRSYYCPWLIAAIFLGSCGKSDFSAKNSAPVQEENVEAERVSDASRSTIAANPTKTKEADQPVVVGDVEAEISSESFAPGHRTKRFEINRKDGLVDVLIAIDQSRSMPQEINLVKENLQLFQSQMQEKVNVRLGLFGQANAPVGGEIFLPPFINKFDMHLPALIKSHDALEDFALFLEKKLFADEKNKTQLLLPETFFREGALKVYFVATDDDARFDRNPETDTMSSDQRAEFFIKRVEQHIPLKDFRLFAFAGTSPEFGSVLGGNAGEIISTCKIAKLGAVYAATARKVPGSKLFDVCLKDWSQAFSEISRMITRTASLRFELGEEPRSVKQVTLSGRVLAPSEYSVSGNVLILSESVSIPETGALEVDYEPRS